MATYTAIDEAAANELRTRLEKGGFGTLGAIVGVPAGSVNSNYRLELTRAGAATPERWFLRLYEEQDAAGAAAESRLLRHLAAHGVATPAPARWSQPEAVNAGGEDEVVTIAGKPAALFPWIEGDMRCQKGVTPEAAAAVGAALAHVHVAGKAIESQLSAGRFRIEDLFVRLEKIRTARDPDLSLQAIPIGERLKKAVAARDPELPRGLVHGDLFRDNVLFTSDGRIAALLDFESASRGVFAYDLAVTVLAWTFGDGFDRDLARAMIAGYHAVRPITAAERRGFAAECTVAALRFTITRITDYAMRAHEGGPTRVLKDWRRFDARARAIEAAAGTLEADWFPS